MIKVFHPRGVKELFWKAGRTTEKVTFARLLKKHPKQAKRALKVAQLKGMKKIEALGKKHKVEGLGVYIPKRKMKLSKTGPFHHRGKDFPDLADDTTIGGVKAYADMPSIKRQLSREATEKIKGWGFGRPGKRSFKFIKDKKGRLHKVKVFE
tara:strand:- start:44 stop:499 length:456 start_codon:yes stop_codon:yes gene_type:complete